MLNSKKNNYGFTLVESAIVILIIGAIVSGIFIGRNLMESSKLTKIMSEKQKYISLVNSFILKYDCLPGDCSNASSIIRSTATNGNGDGKIKYDWPAPIATSPDGSVEALMVWQHLSLAKMIPDSFNGQVAHWNAYCSTSDNPAFNINSPATPYGGNSSFGIFYLDVTQNADIEWLTTSYMTGPLFDDWNHTHIMTFGNCNPEGVNTLPPLDKIMRADEALSIDTKYDDGLPTKGNIRVGRNSECYDMYADGYPYNGTNTELRCGFLFKSEF